MTHCIFCKIVTKEIPATLHYEDKEILAFNDIKPQAPVHLLIIPKIHIERISEIKPDNLSLWGKMLMVANQLAKENNIDQKGYRLVANCNPEAGQTVYHVHLHLLGGRPMTWPPG